MRMALSQNITPADYTAQSRKTDSLKEETSATGIPFKEKAAIYKRVSKDGDTLELSATGKTKIIISDANLDSFSKSRIKQLYSKKSHKTTI